MESPVQHHNDEFAERNLFLQLALASCALGAKFDALLDRWAPPTRDDATGALPGDAPLVDAVLGLIALRTHLQARLDAAALPPRSPPVVSVPTRIPLR